jgi:hypothetical protein
MNLVALGLVLVALAAPASDLAVRRDVVHGVAQIHTLKRDALDVQLARTLASLRRDRGSTPAGEHGRALAIAGFVWVRRGLAAQHAFSANDSGNLPAAVRDARTADRCFARGAALLRAAGRTLGVHTGILYGR